MAHPLDQVKYPELVFGIAGPIGVDVGAIAESIETSLKAVSYGSERIKLTDEMFGFQAPVANLKDETFLLLQGTKWIMQTLFASITKTGQR
jgi:hypothetical protein